MSLRYVCRTCLRAVQGIKDQNSKGMIEHSQGRPRPEFENSTQFRWVSGGIKPMMKTASDVDDNRRIREAEKAENVIHLIFWGPK